MTANVAPHVALVRPLLGVVADGGQGREALQGRQEAQELAVLAVLEPGANGDAVVDLRDR